MIAKQKPVPRRADLEQAITHGIVQRTLGRIRMLEVELTENHLVIRGWTACFHLKQLAIQGVFDVIGRSGSSQIDIDARIAVGTPGSDANIVGGPK